MEAVKICLGKHFSPEKVCTTLPRKVCKSSIYIIDLQAVNEHDLTTDDTGTYCNHSSPVEQVCIEMTEERKIQSILPLRGCINTECISGKGDIYLLKRQYSRHAVHKGVTRIITKLVKKDEMQCERYAVVHYKIPEEFDGFTFTKHGNGKKKTEPYIRTKPSVLQLVREQLKNETPKHIISNVTERAGGAEGLNAPSDILNGRQQVYNQARSVTRCKSRSTGPNKIPDLNKLLCLQQSGEFLKEVSFSVRKGRTKPNTFAATDNQLMWIRNFCSRTCAQSQLHIDMTYNCGPFYLTALTIPHPLFVYKQKPEKQPSILVGMATSSGKEVDDYQFLAASLKKIGKIQTLVYGTDGELALEKGFEDVFPIDHGENIHLRCFEHFKDDMKRKLELLNVPVGEQQNIIKSILGFENDGKRVKGLVDCSADEFNDKLGEMEKLWPDDFIHWIHTSKGRLRSAANTMKLCMLRSVRVAAGLGSPPNKWTNQRAESMNSVLKEELSHQETDQVSLHEIIYKNVAKQQENEMIKSIFKMGEYRLAKEFSHLEVDPSEWCQKTRPQKDAYIKKVFSTTVNTKHSAWPVGTKRVEVSIEDSKLDMPASILEDIWHKAETLMSSGDTSVLLSKNVCVPDHDTAYIVTVEDDVVRRCACDMYKKTSTVCAHMLVAAQKLKCLTQMFSWLEGKGRSSSSCMSKAQQNSGQKPGHKSRKGKNNRPLTPIVDEEDSLDQPSVYKYTEFYQNDEPFQVVFMKDYKRAQQCEGCMNMFCRINFIKPIIAIPFDLIILHKERYKYPAGDGKYVVTRKKMCNRFYCVDKKCIKGRHPYFWKGRVNISDDVKARLHPSHKKLILEQLKVQI